MTPEAAKRVKLRCWSTWTIFSSAKPWTLMRRWPPEDIQYIPDGVLDAFSRYRLRCSVSAAEKGIANLKLVYTPLNGAGLECVKS